MDLEIETIEKVEDDSISTEQIEALLIRRKQLTDSPTDRGTVSFNSIE